MSLRDFEAFVGELVLENGTRMRLEPFQARMLADYFDGVRETVTIVGKKNGKSTLLAALALYHLCTVPDAECVIGAASRDQATVLFDQARGFVRRTPALGAVVQVRRGYRELRATDGDGRIRVLAADADTADGILPTLAFVDELHRHKSGALYDVFRDGLGPRGGQMLTISTAGDDEHGTLGKLRRAAHALPGITREAGYLYARSDGFAWHEWALAPDDDRDDLELVKLANPASWQTIEALRERRDSPSMTPWAWARFACGVWLGGENAAIAGKEWAGCARPGVEIPDGALGVTIGIDLGWRRDTTAIVPVYRPDGDDVLIVGAPSIIAPPGDGTATRVEDVIAAIEAMTRRWSEATLVLDPNAGGEQLAQRLDDELQDVVVSTHSQNATTMALAAQRLMEAIGAGELQHPDDEALNQHVLAAAARTVGEGFRFVKQSRKQSPIDAVIALAMAVSVIRGDDGSAPRYGRATWGSHAPASGPRVTLADYLPCRKCSKAIHPALHEPGANERGLCLACRQRGGPRSW